MAEINLHYNGIRKARSADYDETDVNGAALYLLIPAYILYVLIMLGLLKACIGLTCSTYVGLWGLNHLITLPYPLNNYYERDLAQYRVQYDDDGWPVDPVSQKRTRPINKSTEFCLNVVFFLAIPFACVRSCIKSNDKVESCDLFETCQAEEMDVYCDANDSEAEDTKYILAQMERSEQSLRNYGSSDT